MKYKEISKYPTVLKDVAFVVKKHVTSDEIRSVIKKAGGKLLSKIEIFDVYEGENISSDEKSVAFALTFQDQTRTLSDDEVMTIFNQIIEVVEKKLSARVRDK